MPRHWSAAPFSRLRRIFQAFAVVLNTLPPHHARHDLGQFAGRRSGDRSVRILLLLPRCPLLCRRRAFSHRVVRRPPHPSNYPGIIGSGVTNPGGARNRVRHHAATLRPAGTDHRVRGVAVSRRHALALTMHACLADARRVTLRLAPSLGGVAPTGGRPLGPRQRLAQTVPQLISLRTCLPSSP
jgi:hypothetical protein